MLATIRTILINDSVISNLVGDKVYVSYSDQEIEAPYILIDELFKTPNDCKQEASTIDSLTIGVTAVAFSYKEISDILNRCRVLLDLYRDQTFMSLRYVGLEDMYDGTQGYFVKTNSYQSLIKV